MIPKGHWRPQFELMDPTAMEAGVSDDLQETRCLLSGPDQ
jgi:hypothetical protein